MAELMGNISWVSNKPKIKEKEEIRYIIPTDEFITSKENLLTKCEDLLTDIESLYTKVQNKELYDALVTLNSVKRSINIIHIKNQENG